jgi:hypothetical protein
MPRNAKFYVTSVTVTGFAMLAWSCLAQWDTCNARLAIYVCLSLLASMLKLRLPGLTGTMSIGFVMVLLGIAELKLPIVMLMACGGVVVQCVWRAKRRPAAIQIAFNVAAMAISAALAYGGAHAWPGNSVAVEMAIATCIYFLTSSLLVAGVLALTGSQALSAVWQQCYLIAFPYYLLGGAIAGMMAASGRELGWAPPLALLLVMALAFLFYRIYLSQFRPAGRPVTVA